MKKFICRLLKKILFKYEIMLFPDLGFGEINALGLLMNAYKLKVNKKIIVITCKKSHFFLLKTYSDIDKVILIKPKTFKKISESFEDLNIYHGERQIVNNLMDATINILKLKNNVNFRKQEFNVNEIKLANKKFNELKLEKGKTVLFTPEAVTYNCNVINKDFWLKAAKIMESKGYKVVFNSKELYNGYPSIYIQINLITLFADLCGTVIGLRSGLHDILAGNSNAKIISIYPGNNSDFYKDEGITIAKKYYNYDDDLSLAENNLNTCSLVSMYKNENAKEIFVDTDLTENINLLEDL